MLQLYGMSSPNVRKVLIALHELGMPYAFQHVNLFAGGQFEEGFKRISPNAKVPVLADPETGSVVFESGAILLYLAEHSGELLPRAGAARHQVVSWLMLQMANIGPILGQLNHFRRWAPEGSGYALERFRREARRLYRLLDDRLRDKAFLAGDGYSIADIATYPWAIYLEQHEADPQAHPHLLRWRAELAERPAVAAAMAEGNAIERQDAIFFAEATPEQRERFFGRGG